MKLSLPDIQEVEAITTFNGPLSNERNIIPSGNIQKLKQKMNKLAKVTITDGRSFIGTFTCADKQGNVVLAYSTEYRGDVTRRVGSVIIGKKYITKFEVEQFQAYLYN